MPDVHGHLRLPFFLKKKKPLINLKRVTSMDKVPSLQVKIKEYPTLINNNKYTKFQLRIHRGHRFNGCLTV
jgi:hypothetical protein